MPVEKLSLKMIKIVFYLFITIMPVKIARVMLALIKLKCELTNMYFFLTEAVPTFAIRSMPDKRRTTSDEQTEKFRKILETSTGKI